MGALYLIKLFNINIGIYIKIKYLLYKIFFLNVEKKFKIYQ